MNAKIDHRANHTNPMFSKNKDNTKKIQANNDIPPEIFLSIFSLLK
ncbi:hypothetical protein Pcaca05_16260 [Pectobacterium carotovorum subsp. carotovorum]|nr:hypothetical protein Pcaca05_16260 [Pectobacterium carotovorum subsp. carotovorum]